MQSPSLTETSSALLGVVGSGLLAGVTAGATLLTMPGILSASAPSQIVVKQWAHIFRRGKLLVPMIGLASFLGYASLSYGRWRQGLEWKGLLAAGGLAIGVVPYTLIFLQPTNVRLMDLAGGTTKMASDEVVRGLIVKWSRLNLGRSLLPLVGSIVGLWSLLA